MTCRSAGKYGDLKPHLIRYWLTPPADPNKEEAVKALCTWYEEAPHMAHRGEQTVSTDELTGVQALERKLTGLSLATFQRRATGIRVHRPWHALVHPES
jgi:hypothetical protein